MKKPGPDSQSPATNEVMRDATVLRAPDPTSDSSVSFGDGVNASADYTPRILKQRFVLEEKLGSGGMGTVYRAKDLRKVEARDRQPYVAIKVLNNDFRRHPDAFIALEREASKSQGMSHSNIVSIFDFDKDHDIPFIIMELLEGRELAKLLADFPHGVPLDMAWPIIETMCAGLQHAHESDVVHADFKPGNVYVSSQNQAKILDFGIARAVRGSKAHREDTVFDPGRLAALTPAYASREMLTGDNPEPRDDIFALGVVIYLVLTGHHPYGRMPADEAAREKLRPERPKTLERWRWRTLESMLRFNRQDRPANVAEVRAGLLSRPMWRKPSVIAASLLLTTGLGGASFVNYADMKEVKAEVRQTTLFDAQTQRLIGLLNRPVFDASWESQVQLEFEALRQIDANHDQTLSIRDLIAQNYANRVYNVEDFEEAFGLYQRGSAYGDLEEVEAWLKQQQIDVVHGLLDEPTNDSAWLTKVEQALLQLGRAFPGAMEFQEVRGEIADVLTYRVEDTIAQGDLGLAQTMLESVRALVFDETTVDELALIVEAAEQAHQEMANKVELVESYKAFEADLKSATEESCMTLDGPRLKDKFDALVQRQPKFSTRARRGLGAYVAKCVQRLAGMDQDRAQSLRRDALAMLGDVKALVKVQIDPCGMSYLVGNGASGGRGGYCSDRIEGENGPRLVVIPGVGAERFAITKHEVSWQQFNVYCEQTGRCSVEEDAGLPVTGVSIKDVADYSGWLSERSGYRYRLPTRLEWRLAASGLPDPNRNCRVRVGGVERGLKPVEASVGRDNDYGLINVLGNVQELVADEQGVHAVGGAFVDPIDQCNLETARVHEGQPDAVTGFRLVREVS